MPNPGPVYLVIAEAIRKEIISERLAPHTRLDSEPELARRHQVARETVRRALSRLSDDAVIYRRRGSGSFVAEPRVAQDLQQLFSFTEFMEYMGLRPGSKLLEAGVLRISDPESPILHWLRLKPGTKVVHLRRLRLGSGEPLVVASTWLPETIFRSILKKDLRRHSVYEVMEQMGRKPSHATQTIEAVTLGEAEAKLLTVPAGSAALLIRRVGYSHGVPVEYAVDYYRGDRTRFRVRLGALEPRPSGA